MSDANEILFYVEMIEEISRAPLYNSLEVGFRHSPLTNKEQLDRYRDACQLINQYAISLFDTLKSQEIINISS